jgi:hypothetical protein
MESLLSFPGWNLFWASTEESQILPETSATFAIQKITKFDQRNEESDGRPGHGGDSISSKVKQSSLIFPDYV